MAKGIILILPRSPGTVQITAVDPDNPYRISVGARLQFDKPGFTINLNDTVNCTILSTSTCRLDNVDGTTTSK